MMAINHGLFSSASGEWETPQALFNELNEEFGFNLDACATNETAKCADYFTKEDDALSQIWDGVVFVNPPYGRKIGRWVRKGYLEAARGSTVVMLLPSRTDTRWWHNWVMKADEIRFIKGRLRFTGYKWNAPFPSAIVIFRGGKEGKYVFTLPTAP